MFGDALEAYQLPLREVVRAIQLRNIRATGGSFESYTSDRNIVTLAQFENPEEVGDVIVRSTFEGHQIRVKDLAEIRDDFEPEKTRFRMNGQDVIAFQVFKKGPADIIRVIKAIKAFVNEEKNHMPEELNVMYSSDMSKYVEMRLDVLTANGLIGLALVIVVLFIFLNFRTAFWVSMGIPLSMAGVLFLAPRFGVHVDAISLMGMILVIGLIVDDAIVVAENIAFLRDVEGRHPLDAAVEGTYQVLRPVFATIITTVLAFSPFFFMKGMLGKFIYPIPLVIVLALVISFLEVILVLPAHVTGAGRQKKGGTRSHEWFTRIKIKFQRLVYVVLRIRYIVLLVFVCLLIGIGYYAAHHMAFVLFPSKTAEQFYMTLELPTGASLDATTDKVAEIEDILMELPDTELESFWTMIGSLGGAMMTPGESENWAFLYATLTPYAARNRTAQDIVEELKQKTAGITGLDALRFIVDGGGPPVGRPITVNVVGSNDEMRNALADSLFAFLEAVPGVTDLDRNDKAGKEQVEIELDYPRLSQLGLTVADIAQTVRLAYDGQVVTGVRYDDEDVGFRVLLEAEARAQPGYLGELVVPNNQGRLIRLKDVAQFKTGPGPSSFFHFDGERTVTISADISDEATQTSLEITEQAMANFNLSRDWPGMQLLMAGEAQETEDSIVSLMMALLVAGVGIYLILTLLFNSIFQPVMVMVAIPFGLIGVIGAFALHNQPFGFLSVMGAIGMMGVVVNDSLILVNFINEHRRDFPDKKFLRIVAEGTAGRLRPILLTSITTVCGLLPTAYGFGGSDPFVADMALALGYGILFATPLTLLLLPCLYAIQHDIGRLVRYIPGLGHFYFIPAKAEQDK